MHGTFIYAIRLANGTLRLTTVHWEDSVDRDGGEVAFPSQDVVILQGVTGLNLNTLLTNGNLDVTT